MANLEVTIGSLTLKNPVMLASGTSGTGDELHGLLQLDRVGAVVTKTVTLEPREGNPPPRTVETASGMVNAIGLANIGADAFIAEKLPLLVATGATVITSIAGFAEEEWGQLAAKMDAAEGVSAIELNLSCPNLGEEKLIAQDPAQITAAVSGARAATSKPIIAKLTPNVTDIVETAVAAAGAGADAVTVANTLQALVVDWRRKKSRLGAPQGGFSGPAVKPHILYLVSRAAAGVSIPVIASGGIMTVEDVCEYLCVGASAVQIGTATFVDPSAAMNILDKLEPLLASLGAENLADYVGSFS
jgi:dihydroorotate dehydrogenase (NAD+) catalytic subunit